MKESAPNSAHPEPAVAIDVEFVEAVANIVTRLGLTEIELAHGDVKIRIARQITVAAAPVAATAPVGAPATVGKAQPSAVKSDAPGTVKSPMVGTAYLRASPDAPPFVELGSHVRAGEKLMLVEAMKTFNEIVSPRPGTVTAILVEDGQPVEYGQPLLVIE
jgi:acetyl-CoA carboxylase biotin carboxyl carrier protein